MVGVTRSGFMNQVVIAGYLKNTLKTRGATP